MSQHVTTSPNSQQSCNVVYVILSSFRHRDHRPKMAKVHSRVHFGGTAKSQLWSLCSVLRGSLILHLTAWPARFEVLLRLASHEHGAKSRRYQDFEALCWSLHLIDSSEGAHGCTLCTLHTDAHCQVTVRLWIWLWSRRHRGTVPLPHPLCDVSWFVQLEAEFSRVASQQLMWLMHSDALFFEVPVPMSEVLPKMTHTITIGGKASDIYGTRYDRGKSSECLQDLPCWSDLKCVLRAGYDGYGPYDALEAEAHNSDVRSRYQRSLQRTMYSKTEARTKGGFEPQKGAQSSSYYPGLILGYSLATLMLIFPH